MAGEWTEIAATTVAGEPLAVWAAPGTMAGRGSAAELEPPASVGAGTALPASVGTRTGLPAAAGTRTALPVAAVAAEVRTFFDRQLTPRKERR